MRQVAPFLLWIALVACNAANSSKVDSVDEQEFEGDEPGECSDAADNDRDGHFDCDDQDCFGSPDCAESDTDTDADSDADTDTDTDIDDNPLCPGHVLCDFTGVELTYDLALDFWVDSPLTVDCEMNMVGDGTHVQVGEDNRVTFFGEWRGVASSCSADVTQSALWLDWTTWEAHHSFFFDEDLDVLEDWFAHKEPDAYVVVGPNQSPLAEERFYVTEIDKPFDLNAPTVNWTLDEDVPDVFLTLQHDLTITFTIE